MAKTTALVKPAPFLSEQTSQYLNAIWATLPPDQHKLASGMCIGEQSKYLRWEIVPKDVESDHIELIQITDVQFGHICCKHERILEYRDWILSVPYRFLLWTGDMVDAWAMWSPGRAFEQLGDPQSQVLRFVELWAPARHRVLGYVGGNHERRALPGFGDLGVLIATLLKIPYSNGRQLVDIHFGRHKPFQISLWHGTGGARTKGTVAQTLYRFMSIGDSQYYGMGHLHQPLYMPIWKEERDPLRQRIRAKKVIGAVGSSFMETWGSYGEIAGFGMGDVLMPRIVLETNGSWEVTLKTVLLAAATGALSWLANLSPLAS